MQCPLVPIQEKDVSLEIAARITRAMARKYGCDIEIDFSNGNQKVLFLGSPEAKEGVVGEVWDIFSQAKYSPFRRLINFFTEFIKFA